VGQFFAVHATIRPYGSVGRPNRGCAVSDRIVDCAIAVIASDGLDALSFRRVATAAGVAIGTVQHHHPTRAELVLGALQRTAERQLIRAMATPRRSTQLATLTTRLATLLPHDEASREEAIVWVALAAAAARDPLVGPLQRRIVADTISGITALLDRAVDSGELPTSTDTGDLAQRIDAVVDGYLLHTAARGTTIDRRTTTQFTSTLEALYTHRPGSDQNVE
jgi:AcrR family transcriptional regulator